MGPVNVLRLFVNRSFNKTFDTTFMRNIKNCQK